ncbi:MAG: tetratricopeptide repeat protein, partial [Polyangiaceae bacterium]
SAPPSSAPPPSAPPPARAAALFPEATRAAPVSLAEGANEPLTSSLSDGSVRPDPLQDSGSVDIPRAPAIPNLIPRESEDPPPPSTGSLSPSGEYPAIEFTAYDPTQRKSQLPARAGLYSSSPAAPEVAERRAPRPESSPPPPRKSTPPTALRRSEPAEDQPTREIRSVPPPAVGTTLFQLASWLDEGHADRVLDAVPAHGSDPDQRIMRARALIQLGREEAAASELEAVGAFPLLEPEVRASVARLLLELGKTDQALQQADLAYRDDPQSDPARLALAWAAVRVDRRHNEPIWVKRAHTALTALSTDNNPYPALTLALRSSVLASIGEADKAISVAQRALGLDPDSVDAVAAIALGAARLGRGRDAQEAWCRLLDLDHREADALSETLGALGVALDVAGLGSNQAELRWDDIELRVARGDAHGAREVELHAKRQLERLITGQRLDLQVLGTLSATYLTQSPVFRDFAPFDFSLWSVGRLDAALLALYGHDPRPPLDSDVWPLLLRAGTYLGETLRQAHRGRWNGTLHDARQSRVICRTETFSPLLLVEQRIREGSGHSLALALKNRLADPTSPEWQHRLPSAVLPPTPWRGSWPTANEAGSVSEGLKNSPVSTFCERRGKGRLDGTLSDFKRLDSYLAVLAPPGDDVGDDWSRRACGMLGCHVGEILRAEYDGRWLDEPTTGPNRLQLELRDRTKLEPLSVVQSRLVSDRKFSLEEWCQTIDLQHR